MNALELQNEVSKHDDNAGWYRYIYDCIVILLFDGELVINSGRLKNTIAQM